MKQYRGAEALVTIHTDRVIKQRLPKAYRLPALDTALRKQRIRREIRLLHNLHSIIRVPKVLGETTDTIVMEKIDGEPLKFHTTPARCEKTGLVVGKMHTAQIIHGDLTTSNILVEHPGLKNEQIVLLDFGLAYPSHKYEDMATDIHVFEELVTPDCFEAFWRGYAHSQPNAKEAWIRLEKLKTRGRNKARD